jgi:hypothetical protein
MHDIKYIFFNKINHAIQEGQKKNFGRDKLSKSTVLQNPRGAATPPVPLWICPCFSGCLVFVLLLVLDLQGKEMVGCG